MRDDAPLEMTAHTAELRSIVTVDDEERFRGAWRRAWTGR
jgi:hypothetical protein